MVFSGCSPRQCGNIGGRRSAIVSGKQERGWCKSPSLVLWISLGCRRHRGFGVGCRRHLGAEFSSDPWADEPFAGASAFAPGRMRPSWVGWEMLPMSYSRRGPVALSRVKRLCITAPCFGVCHLSLAAVHRSTNGLFLHVSSSHQASGTSGFFTPELPALCLLCSCLFACHIVCGPAWERLQFRG